MAHERLCSLERAKPSLPAAEVETKGDMRGPSWIPRPKFDVELESGFGSVDSGDTTSTDPQFQFGHVT